MELEHFLENLKVTATSPYSLVAYVILVAGWIYITTAGSRLRSITKSLKDLPEQHRLEILKKEYNICN